MVDLEQNHLPGDPCNPFAVLVQCGLHGAQGGPEDRQGPLHSDRVFSPDQAPADQNYALCQHYIRKGKASRRKAFTSFRTTLRVFDISFFWFLTTSMLLAFVSLAFMALISSVSPACNSLASISYSYFHCYGAAR